MIEFFEALFESLFGELVYQLFRITGASFRFLFLRKYTFREVLSQNWNGRVGLVVVLLIVGFIFWLIKFR
ncbi:hypothetical protein MYP_3450 [Sporocytophaga myxococcoides]|uniref:Uncharacterized protein n=1 Tax=Sporocytophaga myxococcoides TaxID=153721 RepID=A0A098LGU3_9BACT|nr:hypothetical protein MYP_3450 [Sporocytophaga myxococcoides]